MSKRSASRDAGPWQRFLATLAVERFRDRATKWAIGVSHRKRQAWRSAEFVSAALEGLWLAALSFDGSRNDDFFGFAKQRMLGAIIDWMRTEEECSTRTRKANEARGVSLARKVPMPSSMDDNTGLVEQAEVEDLRAVDPGLAVDSRGAEDRVLDLFPPGQARDAVRLYFVVGLSAKTVGQCLGVSASRVCQIVSRAVEAARPRALRLVAS